MANMETRLRAITTKEAKAAATPEAQIQLRIMCTTLLSLGTRDERLAKQEELRNTAHPEAHNFLALTTRREKEHYEFMNNILWKIKEFDMTDRKPHDYSKDDLFLFVVPCYYDGGIQDVDVKEFMESELRRHHTLEAHHPQYEMYTDKECTQQDILEMAIDRLSRNAQYGDGIINLEGMKKFLPTFTLGDTTSKQNWYWECVTKYHDFVQSEFYTMFPDAKEWAAHDAQ